MYKPRHEEASLMYNELLFILWVSVCLAVGTAALLTWK
jgi:hypothetical protein